MSELKEFDDLASFGRLTRSVNVGSHVFVLHTLNSQEYSKLTHSVGDGAPDAVTAERFETVQRWTLAYAIESIDGKELPLETREKILSSAQLATSNLLYDAYSELLNEQNKLLGDAKKNSSEAATS